VSLDSYVDVETRMRLFFEKFPSGCLQSEVVRDDGKSVTVRGFAYRTPDDPRPGVGHAEEVRGDSQVNKRSALENGETSAWGRALVAVGFSPTLRVKSLAEVEQERSREHKPVLTGSGRRDGLASRAQQDAIDQKAARKQLDLAEILKREGGVDRLDQLPATKVAAVVSAIAAAPAGCEVPVE
jgi:hypothetical protein